MTTEVKIHEAQMAILRELLFKPNARFNELLKLTDLSSDHFNFHIAKLIELGYVEKVEKGVYRLTLVGKEYANKLDTDTSTIERQPKVAVVLAIERQHDGVTEYVFQQRRKNPYYGFWGLPTGKVRWGEQITETAVRECMEETGLTADFTVVGVYHELVRVAGKGDCSEDKVFFVCRSNNASGDLVADFEGGHNEWATYDDVLKNRKTYANDETVYKMLEGSNNWFKEDRIKVDEADF
ncbi:hypothetical protein FACS189431_3250 [Alphaproteobacteria bacterium]|nr:hypothetical protein FACS189431_3250 [Alphaproteobacteria bacterium]